MDVFFTTAGSSEREKYGRPIDHYTTGTQTFSGFARTNFWHMGGSIQGSFTRAHKTGSHQGGFLLRFFFQFCFSIFSFPSILQLSRLDSFLRWRWRWLRSSWGSCLDCLGFFNNITGASSSSSFVFGQRSTAFLVIGFFAA